MVIKCGACGKDIEIPGELLDGQRILCPWCGEKTQYSKPARIVLPTAVRPVRRPQPIPTHQPKPIPQPNPELHVIREKKPQLVSVEDPNAKKAIYMAEEHARFYEEMKAKETRRKTFDKIGGLLGLLILVGGAWAGYVFWTRHQERQVQVRLAQEAENVRLERERSEENARQEAARKEREQKDRERRAAEEAAKRKQEAEQREREVAETRQFKELYWQAATLFADADLDLISALGTNALPGQVDGRFFYLVPSMEEDRERIVVCESTAQGVTNLFWLGKSADRERIADVPEFLERADKTDYLLAHGGKVYFHSKRQKPHIGEIDKEKPEDLTCAFLGKIADKAKSLDCDFDNLSFEIVFVSEKPRKVIVADDVAYGCPYSLERVRDAVEEAFPFRSYSRKSSSSKKKFKRTVVFWDGALIKRGIDGITYVPRTPPPAAYGDGNVRTYVDGWYVDRTYYNYQKRIRRAAQTRDHWQSLYDEATKQDAEEQAFYQKCREEASAQATSASAAAAEAYAEKINGIIKNGTLYFRAKFKKGDADGDLNGKGSKKK